MPSYGQNMTLEGLEDGKGLDICAPLQIWVCYNCYPPSDDISRWGLCKVFDYKGGSFLNKISALIKKDPIS